MSKLIKIAQESICEVKPQVRGTIASKRQRRLTAEESVEILQHYQAGASLGALGRQYKVHCTAIRSLLLRSGVTLREQRQMTEAEIEQASELYESGLSLSQVGSRLGYHQQTIWNQLTKHGVQLRPASSPAQPKRRSLWEAPE